MIKPNVKNETGKLRTVVLGIGEEFGGVPTLDEAYDPKSKEHIKNGSFPTQEAVLEQLEGLKKVLLAHHIEVLHPQNIPEVNQVFARDIGFVVGNSFVVPNIIAERKKEVEALAPILEQIDPKCILRAPEHVRFEGGDIMPWNDTLFVGFSKDEDFNTYKVSRTNEAGVAFLQAQFPHLKVIALELAKSDDDPRYNALHLDCTFQPIGNHQAIVFKEGFKYETDYQKIENFFGKDNLIQISRDEMYHMNSNIFSISPQVIISEKSFGRLNGILRSLGYTVEEVAYNEISKMEGLFRCSTLPLVRE